MDKGLFMCSRFSEGILKAFEMVLMQSFWERLVIKVNLVPRRAGSALSISSWVQKLWQCY